MKGSGTINSKCLKWMGSGKKNDKKFYEKKKSKKLAEEIKANTTYVHPELHKKMIQEGYYD